MFPTDHDTGHHSDHYGLGMHGVVQQAATFSLAGRRLGLLMVLALGLFLHGWIVLVPNAVMGFTDALDYLLLADAIRAGLYGHDAHPQVIALFAATRYPPVYPLLLGLLGGSTEHQHTAMIVSNGFAILGALAVWSWARQEFGNLSATIIAAGLLVYPIHFVLNFHTVSEPLSMAVVALAMLLVSRQPARPALLFAGFCLVALAPLVRAANIPLLPAAMIALWIAKALPARPLLMLGLAAALPTVVWFFIRPMFGAEAYTSSFDPQFMLDRVGGWPDALWMQPWRLFTAFVANWGSPGSALAFLLGVAIALLGLAGAIDRAKKGHVDAWFLAGYLGLLSVWPYPAEFQRLLVPAYPFILGCAIHGLGIWLARPHATHTATTSRRAGPWLIAGAILVVQAPVMLRFAHRAEMQVDPELVVDKRRVEYFIALKDEDALRQMEKFARVRGVVDATGQALPDGACVYAADPRLLLTRTRVRALSYPPGITTAQEARNLLTECDYFFVWSFGMRELGLPPDYPLAQLDGWTEPVLVSNQLIDERMTMAAALFKREPVAVIDQPGTSTD